MPITKRISDIVIMEDSRLEVIIIKKDEITNKDAVNRAKYLLDEWWE